MFHSPVAHRPYHGREALRTILAAVFSVSENFRDTDEYGSESGHVLRFRAEAEGRELEGRP